MTTSEFSLFSNCQAVVNTYVDEELIKGMGFGLIISI
jgi:hypothetical protein